MASFPRTVVIAITASLVTNTIPHTLIEVAAAQAVPESTGELLVLLKAEGVSDFDQDELIEFIAANENLVVVNPRATSSFYVLRPRQGDANEALAARVRRQSGVRAVALNSYREALTIDSMYAHQWYLSNTGQKYFAGDCPPESGQLCDGSSELKLQTTPYYDIGWTTVSARYSGRGVKVGVIDSGVDRELGDLSPAVVEAFNTADTYASESDFDGHGTLVASIIAARADNGTGIAGVAPQSSLYIAKDMDYGGEIADDAVVAAFERLTMAGVDVINISQGGPSANPVLEAVIADAVANNVIVIASSGNNGDKCWANALGECVTITNPILYPAAFPGVISVGALDNNGVVTEFSTFNGGVTVAAPGKEILGLHTSTLNELLGGPPCSFLDASSMRRYIFSNGTTGCFAPYRVDSGTSFAAPIVTGAAALMREKYGPKLTPGLFEMALQNASDHPYLPQGQRDARYGYGRLNLTRLLAYNFPVMLVQFFATPQIPVAGQAFTLQAQVMNPEGNADMTSVSADLTAIGLDVTTPLMPTSDGLFTSAALQVPTSISAGTYTISFTATDAGGSVDIRQANLIVSAPHTSAPPAAVVGSGVEIAITGPNGGDDYTTKKIARLKGTMSANVVTISVNDEDVTISPGDTTWSAEVQLDEGDNEVSVRALDFGGVNSAEDRIEINLDTDPPGPVRSLKADGLKLTWGAPRGGDVDGYRVFRQDGSRETKVGLTRKREMVVPTAGTYTVIAEDEAGNKGDLDEAPEVSVGAGVAFQDVPPNHFASPYIAALLGRAVIQAGTHYRPEAQITRAEFTKLVVLALGTSSAGRASFTDVPSGHSLGSYIGTASARGWITGQDGRFYPDRPITRMDAARVIARARSLRAVQGERFTDIGDADSRGVANALAREGLMTGQGSYFSPERLLTRAEAAKIVSLAAGL